MIYIRAQKMDIDIPGEQIVHILEKQLFNLIADKKISSQERIIKLNAVIDGIKKIRENQLKQLAPTIAILDEVRHQADLHFLNDDLLTDAPNVNPCEADGITPLMFAVKQGDLPSVRTLIHAGVNIDSQDEKGRTAIMWALKCHAKSCFEAILIAKPNLDLQDHKGMTVLLRALNPKTEEDYIYPLIKAGVDVNIIAKNGLFALAYCGDMSDRTTAAKIADALITANANVDLLIQKNVTVLHEAVTNDDVELLNKYIKAGANLNQMSRDRFTALTIAIYYRRVQTAQILIEAGANVNLPRTTSNSYPSPLDLAIDIKSLPIVTALLKHKADIHNEKRLFIFLDSQDQKDTDVQDCLAILKEKYPALFKQENERPIQKHSFLGGLFDKRDVKTDAQVTTIKYNGIQR